MAKELNDTITAIVSNIETLESKQLAYNDKRKVLQNEDDELGIHFLDFASEVEAAEYSEKIKTDLIELYKLSGKHNYFFPDCPLEVYKNNFQEKYQIFKEEYVDVGMYEFIEKEVSFFDLLNNNRFISDVDSEKKLNYSHYTTDIKHFEYSKKSKIQFLTEELNKLGFGLEVCESDGYYDEIYNYHVESSTTLTSVPIENKEVHTIEEVDFKKLTTNQIVVLLDKLGFFTHPNIEEAPKVKQAELISLITGLNSKNIKTSIQKLDKKPSEISVSYQKDIDKIDKILDGLV